MVRTLLLLIAYLLIAAPSVAQTNPVLVGQAFAVQYDHDGQNVTGFQCSLDGKPLGAVLPPAARQCAIPGQTVGPHTIVVTAINSNAFGTRSAASQPLTATAGNPPSDPQAPTNLRITVQVAVQPSGDVTLLATKVEREP